MKSRQNRFIPIIELLLIGGLVIIVAVAGVAWWRTHRTPAVQPPPPGWAQYKSTHSTVQFQYPATWKLSLNHIAPDDKFTLEDVSLSASNSFALSFNLSKTNHGPALYAASCEAPPKVTVASQLPGHLSIAYASYNGIARDIWLYSSAKSAAGFGYATGPCRVRGNDYVALPGDLYTTFTGSTGFDHGIPVDKFVANPDIATAIAIFKTFSR